MGLSQIAFLLCLDYSSECMSQARSYPILVTYPADRMVLQIVGGLLTALVLLIPTVIITGNALIGLLSIGAGFVGGFFLARLRNIIVAEVHPEHLIIHHRVIPWLEIIALQRKVLQSDGIGILTVKTQSGEYEIRDGILMSQLLSLIIEHAELVPLDDPAAGALFNQDGAIPLRWVRQGMEYPLTNFEDKFFDRTSVIVEPKKAMLILNMALLALLAVIFGTIGALLFLT